MPHLKATEAIRDATKAILADSDFNETAKAIFEASVGLTGAASGCFAVFSGAGEETLIASLDGGGAFSGAQETGFPKPFNSLRAQACESGETLFENKPAITPRAKKPGRKCPEISNVLFSPVMLGGKAAGCLTLADKPGGFTGEDAVAVSALCGLAALALRTCRRTSSAADTTGRTGESTGTAADTPKVSAIKREVDENILQTIFDSSPAEIFFKDTADRYIAVNPAFEREAGYTRQQAEGATTEELFPDSAEIFREQDRKVIATGRPLYGIIEEIKKGDSTRWRRTDKIPLKDAAGSIRGIIGFSLDITEAKKAESEKAAATARLLKQHEILVRTALSPALVSGDVEELASQITETVSSSFGIARVSVWLLNEDSTELCCIDLFNAAKSGHSHGYILKKEAFQNEFEHLEKAQYVYADDPLTDPRTAGYAETYIKPAGITALLHGVIRTGGRTIGTVCFEHAGIRHKWEKEEIAFACQIADQISIAVLNRERRLASARKGEQEHYLRTILQTAVDGFWVLDRQGMIIDVNQAYCTMSGYAREELQAMNIVSLDSLKKPAEILDHIKCIAESGSDMFETSHRRKDGSVFDAEISVTYMDTGGGRFVCFCRDITDRKIAESEREITLELLSHLNRQNGLRGLMEKAIRLMREWSGCDAVGIRLADGDDFPYFETRGFPAEFVEAENSLCAMDDSGGLLRDSMGNPIMECMCGNVIQGRFDPNLPFFTETGSFWTNSTSELLASTSEEDRQARTRNRCNGEGYESVALIPLRCGTSNLGLLQFNDFRRDRFTRPKIALLERLASNLAIGLLQRKTAEALSKSEQTHRALVESSPDVIIRFDRECRHLFVSQNISEMVGFQPGDLIGKSHRDMGFSEKLCKFWEDAITGVFDSEKPFETEFEYDSVKGRIFINWRLVPEYDAAGELVSVLSLARDVTEHRAAEQKYQMLFNEMLDGFALHEIMLDENGEPCNYRFLAVNPSFERLTGLSAKEITGKTVLDVLPKTERHWIETYGRIAITGEPVHFESFSGDLGRHYEVTAFRPAPMRFACIFTDITERKRAEKEQNRLWNIIERSLNEIYVFDTDSLLFQHMNQGALKNLGYTIDEIKQLTPLDLKPEFSEDRFRSMIAPLIDGTLEKLEFETLHRRKDGSTYPVEVHLQIIRQGNERYFVAIVLDITGRRQAEEALRRSEERFSKAFKSNPAWLAIGGLDDWRILEVNDEWARIMGYSRDEVVGRTPVELGVFSHDTYAAQIKELREKGSVRNHEYMTRTKAGEERYLLASREIIEIENVQYLLAMGLDITERKRTEEELKRSEERFSKAFKSNPAWLVIVSLDSWKMVEVNDEWTRIMGFSREEAVGRTPVELGLFRHGEYAAMINELEEKGSVRNHEYTTLTRNGEERRLLASREIIEIGNTRFLLAMGLDITERKRTEESLRTLAEMLDTAPNAITVHDANGRFLYANRETFTLHGYTEEEFMNLSLSDVDVPESEALFKARVAQVREKGELRFEAAHFRKDGSVVPLEVFAKQVLWGGEPAILSIATDISERKKMETAIKEKAEELDRYFTSSLDLLCIADTDGHFFRLNPEWEKTLGYSVEELEGKIFLDFVHPDDLEATLGAINRLESQEEVLSFENRYRHKDGSYRWMEWRSKPIGKIIYATARDVTDRKRAEEELRKSEQFIRSINDNLLQGMIYQVMRSADGSRRFTYLSDMVKTFYGITPEQGMADPGLIYGRVHEDDRVKLLRDEERAIETLTPFESETRMINPDGSVRWSYLISHPRVMEDGSTCWDGIEFDITDRKLMQEEKDKLQAQLLQAQKMEAVGQLAGGMAHDFNNMLGIIMSATELARIDTPADSPAQEEFVAITDAVKKARDLTLKLLTFSRREKIEARGVDADMITGNLHGMLKRTIPKNIELVVNKSGSRIISCDQNQIHQALINVCINAVDAMPGGGRLIIETSEAVFPDGLCAECGERLEGMFCLIQISDTGTGMSKDILPKVTEPFFTTKGIGKGTGLGLSVTLGIVKSHGGHLHIYSEPGRGTCVKIYLPLAEGSEDAREDSTSHAEFRGSETILIIDDEEPLLQLAGKILKKNGYEPVLAKSGDEALKIYEEHGNGIAAIVLDLIMPGMDGAEVSKHLKEINSDVRIVFSSGFSINGLAGKLLKDKYRRFVQKPFEMASLCLALRELLDEG